jgi:hypothetical protein
VFDEMRRKKSLAGQQLNKNWLTPTIISMLGK